MEVLLNALYKGGVSKTTQNFIFANLLARKGYKVLFIDFDPQMNGTVLLTGMSKDDEVINGRNIFEAIKTDDLASNILEVTENIDIVPGSKLINLFDDVMKQKGIVQFHLYFKALIEQLTEVENYDFILLDMGPAKSKLNTAVMAAATSHIVVTQSEILSMDNIEEYVDDIHELIDVHGIDSKLLGISIGMQSNTKLNQSVVNAIKDRYEETVFNTIIRRRNRLQEYAVTGFPDKNRRGMYNREDSDALRLHIELLGEVLDRLGLPRTKGVSVGE